MLYDNAQLVSLYAQAWKAFNVPLYEEVVRESLTFIAKEMTSANGGFYSALDADSEGVEGKYYTWSKDELQQILKEDSDLFFDYYNVNERGYWENEQYILLRHDDDQLVAERNNLTQEILRQRIAVMKDKLLKEREKRNKPGLDDKIICSWNALMLKGYVDGYVAFGDMNYLVAAERNAAFIMQHLSTHDGGLIRSCMDKFNSVTNEKQIPAFLDDYAFSINAFISLYQATFNDKYLQQASEWMKYIILNFSDDEATMFYFTSVKSERLISRKIEVQDNVIPSANAMMANNLFLIGHYFENDAYVQRSNKMLHHMMMTFVVQHHGLVDGHSLLLQISYPFYEVVIVGNDANKFRKELFKHSLPQILLAGSIQESDQVLLKNRFVKEETLLYVCKDKVCQLSCKNNKRSTKFKSIPETIQYI